MCIFWQAISLGYFSIALFELTVRETQVANTSPKVSVCFWFEDISFWRRSSGLGLKAFGQNENILNCNALKHVFNSWWSVSGPPPPHLPLLSSPVPSFLLSSYSSLFPLPPLPMLCSILPPALSLFSYFAYPPFPSSPPVLSPVLSLSSLLQRRVAFRVYTLAVSPQPSARVRILSCPQERLNLTKWHFDTKVLSHKIFFSLSLELFTEAVVDSSF